MGIMPLGKRASAAQIGIRHRLLFLGRRHLLRISDRLWGLGLLERRALHVLMRLDMEVHVPGHVACGFHSVDISKNWRPLIGIAKRHSAIQPNAPLEPGRSVCWKCYSWGNCPPPKHCATARAILVPVGGANRADASHNFDRAVRLLGTSRVHATARTLASVSKDIVCAECGNLRCAFWNAQALYW